MPIIARVAASIATDWRNSRHVLLRSGRGAPTVRIKGGSVRFARRSVQIPSRGDCPGQVMRPGYLPLMRLLILLSVLLFATAAAAQDTDLELVLLADASGSIDQQEIELQRQGYALALTDPSVLDAIANTAYGSIAVTYIEWAETMDVVVPWMRIATEEQALAFAAALQDRPRRAIGRNAIGAALLEGKRQIEENDIDGWRKVIDFSGDSARNFSGPPIEVARQEVIAAGITINALPILRAYDLGRGNGGLEDIYEDRIIGGRGAFMVAARSRATFAEALKRKLILEISETQTDRHHLATVLPRP